jgi:hypothetical protein
VIYVETFYAILFCGFIAKGKSESNSYLNLKVDASPSLTRVLLKPSNLRPVKYPPTIPSVAYKFGVLTNNKFDQVLRWVASY